MTGPLIGLRVVEMEGIGPGPLAGQLLADQGAEVVVLSRSSTLPPVWDVNSRGKKVLQVNLKSEKGLAKAQTLIDKADILIEGFRPGVMERLGLGPDACLARNPGLVYGRMTGWGQTGPKSMQAGHDITYLAATGALHMMGRADHPPSPPLNLAADYGGGTMFLLFGLLSALHDRTRTGLGQVVDAAMFDGVSALMGVFATMRAAGEWRPEREANLIDGGAPWYGVYETADSKFVAIGAIEPQFFAEFARLACLDEGLVARRDDRADWANQRREYAALFRTRTRDEWAALFAGTDACVEPVLAPEEIPLSETVQARGSLIDVAGVPQAVPAPRFSRSVPENPVAPRRVRTVEECFR